MSQTLAGPKTFIITYDDGEGIQTLNVPQKIYENESEFQKNIISMKCLDCNFESHFDCIEKENKIGS